MAHLGPKSSDERRAGASYDVESHNGCDGVLQGQGIVCLGEHLKVEGIKGGGSCLSAGDWVRPQT